MDNFREAYLDWARAERETRAALRRWKAFSPDHSESDNLQIAPGRREAYMALSEAIVEEERLADIAVRYLLDLEAKQDQ